MNRSPPLHRRGGGYTPTPLTVPNLTFRIHDSVASIPEAQWNALRDDAWTPFQERTWMLALEETGCATRERGWTPMHMALWRGG